MLKRENRLSQIVRRAGEKKYFSPLFHVKVSENKENKARFGFVVSKKIDKRAVVRNKTKRALRDTAKELINSVLGKDIIIIAKKSLSSKDKDEIKKELGGILNK